MALIVVRALRAVPVRRRGGAQYRPRRGFTMIELMVVVVVIAILAAVAIPIYGKYVKSSRVTEATARIGEIVTAAKSWAMEHQNQNGEPLWPSGSGGIVSLSATGNFSYAFSTGLGMNARTNPLTIVATGKGGTPMAGVQVLVVVPNIVSSALPPQISGL